MRPLLATFFIAITLSSTGARAADAEDAAIQEGIRQMGGGHYEKALALFLQAKQLAPTPRTDAQIAIAEQALEHFTDAEIHLQEVLEAKNDPWVDKNRKNLEESLAAVRAHLGALTVIGKPAGADVRLEGNLAGTVPMHRPLRLHIGSVRVHVNAPGFVGQSQRVEIVAGRTTTIEVDLPKVVAPPLPPPKPPVPVPPPMPVVDPPGTPVHPHTTVSDPYRSTRMGGWMYAVGGAVLMSAGAYLRYGSQLGALTTRQAFGAGLIGGGATALLCGTVIVVASQPVTRGTQVGAASSVALGVAGTF